MRLQSGISFFLDCIGQAITTDHDNRIQVVRIGAMQFALRGGKLYLRHGLIIGDTQPTGTE